ncbi:MAG: hypothetical protein P8X65_13475 [Syntrophobacterales bacterium]|jgi:hypothetical protein
MMLGCYWGEKEHERIWVKCLELIANLPSESGEDIWIKLRLYPALLLLYSGGIAAIAGERYRTFRALLTKAWLIDERKELPVVLGLNIPRIMEPNEARKLPGMQNHKTPLSDYLFNFLRESFKDFLPQDFLYQIYFDKFEYLSSLVYVDLNKKEVGPKEWGPIGCFGWRRIGQRENTIMEKINLEIENDREKWPPLKAGLFNGSLERFTKVKQAFDTFIADLNWY